MRPLCTIIFTIALIGFDLAGAVPTCSNCTVISREQFLDSNGTLPWVNLVPKCCNITQRIVKLPGNAGSECTEVDKNGEFAPLIHTFNSTGFRPINYTSLTVVVGNPCPFGKYPLEPKNEIRDEFYIFYNGDLFLPRVEPNSINLNMFCLEYYQQEGATTEDITPFVCYDQQNAEKPSEGKKFILYAIGLLISVPFLLCTFLVYVLIPELNDVHGKSLACHVLCLGIAFFSLATVQLAGGTFPRAGCVAVAFLIQFFFIACFFWLNVMCIDTWLNVKWFLRTGTTRDQEYRHFIWYSIYAWSCPILLLIVSLIMDLSPAVPATYVKPSFGDTSCWFNSDTSAFPYFYGPVIVLITINVVLFILTAKELAGSIQEANEIVDIRHTERFETVLDMRTRWRKYKKLFRLCFLLFVVMGINWSLEVVSWIVGGTVGIWTFFDIINALQGVFIFIIFVLQTPVKNLVLIKIRKLCKPTNSETGDELQNFTRNTSCAITETLTFIEDSPRHYIN